MSSLVSNHGISTSDVLVGSWATPLPLPFSEVSLQFGIPKFNLEFSAPLIELIPAFEVGEVTIKAAMDANVIAILTLTGKLDETSATFQTERFSFVLEASPRRPQGLFVASSLMAMIGLSGEMSLKIPEVKMGQTVCFDVPLPVTCARLEERQLAYRAMIIEKATGRRFLVPTKLTGADMGSVAFAYHAIVDKSFLWPNKNTFKGSIPADEKGRTEFSHPTVLTFKSLPITRRVFGETLQLGSADLIIEDAIVADFKQVMSELAADDGHEVQAEVRSLTGRSKYNFLTSPSPPSESWGPFLQMLINIEEQLDAQIIERYNLLATSTLLDLTAQEKVEATVAPEVDENGFDWEMTIDR